MNKDRRITREELKIAIHEAYIGLKDNNGGKNADYIPYLANVDSNLFGISVCLPDGEILSVGDCDYRFGMESISKVATAILILRDYGGETVMKMIGADATGMPFNSILAILLENEHPSTPLVNAGAISAVSMVRPVGNSRGKWEAIKNNIAELCGSETPLIDELYESESFSNHRNRSIAWLLKSYNRIYDEPDIALDLYTRQCSLGVTARQLSIRAATIACGGYNPVTKKEVHGHKYSPDNLPPLSGRVVFLSGHTHLLGQVDKNGIPCINPGSVSLPKGGNPKSYATYENGIVTIKTLDGNTIEAFKI